MFKSLQLKTDITKEYITNEEDNNLDNLSRINIFIGPNNSGKSRFLRDLFITKEHLFDKESINMNQYDLKLDSLFNELKIYDYESVINLEILCSEEFNDLKTINDLINNCKDLQGIGDNSLKNHVKVKITNSKINSRELVNIKDTIVTKTKELINLLENSKKRMYIQNSIYIPILRGLRSINYQNGEFTREDFYYERTIRDYFKESKTEFNKEESTKSIYTGLSLYDDVQKLLLGNHEQRKLVKDFESFLSETFFQNKEITIIPRLEEKDVYIHIEGDDEDRPIYNLGEGVQAIIILTYPLFFNKGKNLKVYIEEPDVYLHPGFQRILIETLLKTKGFKDFQYFFTTHSNHFLDMTLDYQKISVYKFSKDDGQFYIDNIDNPDITLLEHLGVKNSSVFLTNCTIWVEGITDRIYIRKYLELYQESDKVEKYFEDVHYSFVEYGGNNITHWSFLDKEEKSIDVKKLCGKLFLISDNDNAKAGSEKYKRIQQLKENLGDRYYCLNVKEIENLLTKESLLKTLKFIDKAKDKNLIKVKNNKQFKGNSAVGTFIDKNIDGLNKNYANKSGTIKDKVQFAQGVVNEITSFEDVREEAKILTEKLYNFISANNNS
ncbi:ATP-binding protein [Chishuiella sp.]|uniref:ATP-dependent nuclease n=1 Tax=Chishuiella sp. TaxID=1969467 RepID=UPI0028ACFA2B|nr:ATP-binding protein [Chishuiella sp.]